MSIQKLPDKRQWDRIVREAFSGTEQHTFSDRYRRQRDALQKGMTMKDIKKDMNAPAAQNSETERRRITVNNKKKRGLASAVAAAAAAAVIVPSYAVLLSRNTDTVPSSSELAAPVTEEVTEGIEEVTEEAPAQEDLPFEPEAEWITPELWTELTWLPEGVVYNTDGPHTGKYTRDGEWYMTSEIYYEASGLTPEKVWKKECESDLADPEYVDYYTEDIGGGRTVMTFSDNVGWRRTILIFDGTNYGQIFFFNDTATDEEIARLLSDSVQLTDNDSDRSFYYYIGDMSETSGEPEADDFAEESADGHMAAEAESVTVPDAELLLLGVGETDTGMEPTCETDENGDTIFGSYSVTLDDFWYQDTFTSDHCTIATDGIGLPMDYSQYTDAAGELLAEDMTILAADLTYTNSSDYEMSICVCPTMFTIQDGTPLIMGIDTRDYGYGGDTVSETERFWCDPQLHFSYSTGWQSYAGENKNDLILAPGESASVRLAYAVPKQFLGSIYLDAVSSGEPAFDMNN